jgi:hypothetical protein
MVFLKAIKCWVQESEYASWSPSFPCFQGHDEIHKVHKYVY